MQRKLAFFKDRQKQNIEIVESKGIQKQLVQKNKGKFSFQKIRICDFFLDLHNVEIAFFLSDFVIRLPKKNGTRIFSSQSVIQYNICTVHYEMGRII